MQWRKTDFQWANNSNQAVDISQALKQIHYLQIVPLRNWDKQFKTIIYLKHK